MESELRNKVLNQFLEKCNFIGSMSIRINDQVVEAIKDAQAKANEYEGSVSDVLT